MNRTIHAHPKDEDITVKGVIIWVASFPRSGNTFLRIILKQLYGVYTSTVYDVDGVAARLGPDLIGFEERPEGPRRFRTTVLWAQPMRLVGLKGTR
jgi:hypothetical protein